MTFARSGFQHGATHNDYFAFIPGKKEIDRTLEIAVAEFVSRRFDEALDCGHPVFVNR